MPFLETADWKEIEIEVAPVGQWGLNEQRGKLIQILWNRGHWQTNADILDLFLQWEEETFWTPELLPAPWAIDLPEAQDENEQQQKKAFLDWYHLHILIDGKEYTIQWCWHFEELKRQYEWEKAELIKTLNSLLETHSFLQWYNYEDHERFHASVWHNGTFAKWKRMLEHDKAGGHENFIKLTPRERIQFLQDYQTQIIFWKRKIKEGVEKYDFDIETYSFHTIKMLLAQSDIAGQAGLPEDRLEADLLQATNPETYANWPSYPQIQQNRLQTELERVNARIAQIEETLGEQ